MALRRGKPLRKRVVTELDLAITELAALEERKHDAVAAHREAHDRVLSMMKRRTIQTILPDGTIYQVTRASRPRSHLDTDKLRKRIGATLFNKLHTRQFDEGKLQAAIQSKEISAVVVASCIEETDGTSYLRTTRK